MMKLLTIAINNKQLLWPISILLFALGACNGDITEIGDTQIVSENSFTINGSISIPQIPVIQSRGVFNETPGSNLKLTLLEFDLGADPEHTFLSNIYKANLFSTSAVQNEGIVTFNVTLTSSTTPKVLHLVVADDYVSTEYGSVATILPSLIIGQINPEVSVPETEAYWGYVEFPEGYNTVDDDYNVVLDEVKIKKKLTQVPVIRNFAQISVTKDAALTYFELLGFDLINVPTSGTAAPWDQNTRTLPTLLYVNDPDNSELKIYYDPENLEPKTYKMLPFADVKENYGGITPGIAILRNTETDAKDWDKEGNAHNFDNLTKFMYEHPYEATRRTYIIVHGRFKDPNKENSSWEEGYYKIDIGKPASDGTFDYYNIIRNVHYNIVLQEVLAAGMETVAEAITRAPFNNLIAATETSSMLNVSDGLNMLIVNDTNHIIVDQNQPVDVLYRYITNVTTSKDEANSIPNTPGLETGTVIDSFTVSEVSDESDPNVKWMKISITPNAPTDIVQTQDFSIVDANGLGRTIHLVLRKPWEYAKLGDTNYTATIAPGIANLYTTPEPQNISNQAGEDLTVYFNLPDGLPESMFPLDFQLEARYQGIENNKIGTLVVSTGPSLFPEKEGEVVISYVKTVSYNEYIYQHLGTSNDINFNAKNINHTIRCRFTTILGVASQIGAEIRIHNPYFSPDASVVFNRVAL